MRLTLSLLALSLALPGFALATPARLPQEKQFSLELPESKRQADPYTVALENLVTGKLDLAEAGFQAILKSDPKASNAMLGLAEVAFRKKRFSEGEARLKEALKASPNDPYVHSSLGRFHAIRGDSTTARRHLTEATRLYPDSIPMRMDLGDFYNGRGNRPDLALKEYESVLAINPEHAGAHYAKGIVYQKQGKNPEAIKELTRSTQLEPSNPIPFEALARLYAQERNYDQALKTLDDLLARHSNLARPRILRAEILSAMGDGAGSLKELELVEKSAPNNPEFVLRLAMAYHAQGKLEEASAKYQKAIDLDPNGNPVAYNNWAAIALQQGKKLDEAEARARKGVLLADKNADFHETLGQVLLARDKNSEALREFEKAKALAPKDAPLLSGIGLALANKGMSAQARPYLERALQISPNYSGSDQAKKVLATLKK